MSADPFNIGLLGHGTVGSAFVTLLDERAAEIERVNGRRPVISGVLTRSRGDFSEILADSDLVVELMGGIEPAREYMLAAMRAGKDVVCANKQLLSQHGEELFGVAREHGVLLRFEAAVAGAVPVVRLLEESLAATPIERIHGIVNGTTNLHPQRDGPRQHLRAGAGRGPAQGLCRGRPERRCQRPGRGGEDGDPRASRVRCAGPSRRRALRGHRAPAGRRHGVCARAGSRSEADRHGRASRRRDCRYAYIPRFCTPGIHCRRCPARSTR